MIAFSIIFFSAIFKLIIYSIKKLLLLPLAGFSRVFPRLTELKCNNTLVIPIFVLITIHTPFLNNIIYENNILKSIDNSAQEYVSDTFVRASASYATARLINAGVSMIQETTIDITPFGLGMSLAAGQILDPLNDMVERFSCIILVSIISTGIMKTMIEIGPFLSIQCILSISMLLFILSCFTKERVTFNWGKSLLLVAIFVRLSVPSIAYLNNGMYQNFLSDKLQTSTAEISKYQENLLESQKELSNIRNDFSSNESIVEEESSFWSTTKRALNGDLMESVKVQLKKAYEKTKEILTNIKNKTTNAINHLIDLCLLYILNTIVFPIGFLWIGIFLLKKVSSIDLQPKLDDKIRKQFQPLKSNNNDNVEANLSEDE